MFKKVIKDTDMNPTDGGKDFDPSSVGRSKGSSIQGKPTMKKTAPGDQNEDAGNVRKSKDYKSLMSNLKVRGPKLKKF